MAFKSCGRNEVYDWFEKGGANLWMQRVSQGLVDNYSSESKIVPS